MYFVNHELSIGKPKYKLTQEELKIRSLRDILERNQKTELIISMFYFKFST